MATTNNPESQPIWTRLAVLFMLMAFTWWAIDSVFELLLGFDIYWQIPAAITLVIFALNYRVFATQVPELTTVIVIDELFGKWLGERPSYTGQGTILTFPWEEVKADNVFTNETFSTGDMEEGVPGKDNLRGIIRGYIAVEITPQGAKTFNARGQNAKTLALSYLDGLFRQFASLMVESAGSNPGRISIDDLIDKKSKIKEAFKPHLEKYKDELFALYGLELRDCAIKDVDFDEGSRKRLDERAARSLQISGDRELMTEVSKVVEDLYGDGLSADEKRDAVDSVMAGMSATGDNVTNRITSLAGINTTDVVEAVLEFLKSRNK